ncbi:unnamed protein product [Euphydryas editha]|uniref:PiggyBac transposable element-derived protein domain-containing protein n=1 Tax=Euphydryas editha TaxID=104508 RepID=A0AAU9THX8_EUPED|nr:unnamed protein product [Euphydryas editha]
MLDLAFKSDVVEEDRSDLVEKDKSDIAEDTIPKYRRVYQRITAESLPSSRKVEILHNVRIRSPTTLDVTASTSGCSMTPKRRKILNDNIEEGNPQIFLSPSTRSSFHVLQNAEIQKSPASDQFEVKKNWSPFCEVIRNKDLNISSTVSRCSSVSNLSCAQYLTCPLSDDQVTEILATNENFSLVRENTCDEPTCNPKCLDNINSSNNIQKCIDPSKEALFKSPNNHLSNNIKKGIKLSEEALIKAPNNDSSNNIQKGIEPSEEVLIKSPTNDSTNNIQKGIEPSEEALIKSPNYDSSNNIQKIIVPSDEALVMSPDYYSSNDEDEDYSPGSDDSDSSLSEYCETSEDDSLENEDVQNNVNQNEINYDHEWQDITDTVPNFPEYEGEASINVPLTAKTPTDYYKLLVTDEIIHKMVNETNNYAYNYIDSSRSRMKPKSRLKAWVPTDSEEMKRFLGVLMAMGLVKVPHINDYWSKKSIYKNEYIMSVMKRDRFLLLLKCWHFSDPQSKVK